MHEVLSVQPTTKRPRQYRFEPGSIIFTKVDLKRVQHPQSDPLVIQLHVHNYDVKRILVHSKSSIEVMYYDIFKQLNLDKEELKIVRALLVGFNA